MKKKLTTGMLSLLLCFALLFSEYAFAATVTYKTQRVHDSADIAWLRDFVIRESGELSSDLSVLSSEIAETVTLTPKPDALTSADAAAFKEQIAKYCELYTLSDNAPRAAYVYLFELMNLNSAFFSGQVSDGDVRDYLENAGIAMPAALSADEAVLARVLYVAMITGTFNVFTPEELGRGVAFEKALVKYLISFSGLSERELLKWVPGAEITSFDEYVLAASRLALWTSGFDVSVDLPESEVYRLAAVLTLRNMGLNVGTDVSLEALKAKYTAALMGALFDVNVEPDRLSQARETGAEAFYLLQLLGKKADLVIDDSLSFEQAFVRVAEKTDAFALEDGEFYADVYRYEAQLKHKRSTLWLFPVSYLTGQEDAVLNITVNGASVPNNAYSEIRINPEAEAQNLTVEVRANINGRTSVCKYVFTILQGEDAPADKTPAGNESSTSIISRILSSFGADASITALMDGIYETLPGTVKNVMSFIAPTFETVLSDRGSQTTAEISDTLPTQAETFDSRSETVQERLQNSYFVGALDKIGRMIDFVIYGISGVELNNKYESRTVDHNFITFE